VAAAAEAAWLGGDNHVAIRLCRPVLDDVLKGHETSELWSELGYWMAKAGSPVDLPKSDRPYALLTTGRWQQAAEHWRRAGCPYEYAMALTESSAPDDLLTALEQLDALGATPLARITRRRLRDLGISRIPRGPAATTRENPAGLTGRQLEVLRLLVDGRSNSDIATELVISVRTAENHVSAVLDKLGVSTRAEAVALALDLGLVTEDALRAAEK
jgi:DNA-binding CsgD family transcriptional regulator